MRELHKGALFCRRCTYRTCIICAYTDGTEEDIDIEWDESNEDFNGRQQVVRKGDQLYIRIM